MQYLDTWLPVRVGALRDLTPSIRELRIDGAPPGSCMPGAHINVRVTIGDQPHHRSYSVTRQQPDGSLFIAVKRAAQSRGGSAFMWSLQQGSRLQITPPACNFALHYGPGPYLLIAGGIGITPIYSMALALAARGAALRVLYAARSADEFAFRQELQAALGSAVEFVCADEGQHLDIAAEVNALPAAAELYVCGPMGLMDAVRKAWAAGARAHGTAFRDLWFQRPPCRGAVHRACAATGAEAGGGRRRVAARRADQGRHAYAVGLPARRMRTVRRRHPGAARRTRSPRRVLQRARTPERAAHVCLRLAPGGRRGQHRDGLARGPGAALMARCRALCLFFEHRPRTQHWRRFAGLPRQLCTSLGLCAGDKNPAAIALVAAHRQVSAGV